MCVCMYVICGVCLNKEKGGSMILQLFSLDYSHNTSHVQYKANHISIIASFVVIS